MRADLFWLLSFCGFAALSLVCGLLAWPQLASVWPSIQEQIDRFHRMPPFAKVVLLLFVGAFVVYGSSKTNQVDQTSGTNEVEIVGGGGQSNLTVCAFGLVRDGNLLCPPPPNLSTCRPTPPVTPKDIARSWQLCEVRTNCNVSYSMPENATLATNWWERGAYEDVKRIELNPMETTRHQAPCTMHQIWRFPFGTNECSSLWAFTWGKVRFALADTNAEIVAVGVPMSAVPYRSRLWSAADTNDSRLVTWENFALNRNTNTPVNAQIELLTTGDFVTRSNEVEMVYRRVNPDDYDGDGWENGDDPDPYVGEEFGDYFYQELPDGANEAAYCWIEVRPKWNSDIWFYGDAPSDLDDPYIYGKAGETYRVQLLIGKTYYVEGSQPVDVVAKSDERIEVSNVEPDSFTVVWPVTFTVADGRAPTGRPRLGATWNDGGKSFFVMPNPPWLRGAVTWTDNHCCDVWGDGTNFTYACDNTCTCEGCTVYGSYWYEGYGLPVWGVPCGCHCVPDQGPVGVSISFDRPAVIYEDAYTNQPGVVVHPARSNAMLRCSVSGGTYGGTFSVTLNEAAQQKLRKVRGNTLPQNVRIEPGSSRSYEVEYSVLKPSGSVGDIGAEARFLEDFHNKTHTNAASMTAVKLELEAVYIAPTNHNQSRHIYGVGEDVRFSVTPSIDDVRFKVVKGDTEDMMYPDLMSVYDTFEKNFEVRGSATHIYTCPISANYVPDITVSYADIIYRPTLEIVEPEVVITPLAERGANIVDLFYGGNRYCWTEGTVGAACLKTTNYIGPMHVSFQGIAVSELPCTEEDVVTGCFTNGHHRTHTGGADGAGAGVAHYIQPGNFWFVDGARMVAPEPNWSPDSTLSWKIPIGWHRKNPDYNDDCDVQNPDYEKAWDRKSRPLLIGGRTDKYKQVWHIDGQGTFRTDKFGHWISRSRDCVIILDGKTIQTEHQ